MMSGHLAMRLSWCAGRIEEILETDPANLMEAYYIEDNDVDVPGIGTVDTSHSFCEDCAEEIRDHVEVSGHGGVGEDSHCSFCNEPLFFLVTDAWMEDEMDAEDNNPPKRIDPAMLHALEIGLERMRLQINANGIDPQTVDRYLAMVTARINRYVDSL